jgi:hypothetical protein
MPSNEVKVNAKMWHDLSSEQRSKIEEILKSTGLLHGAEIKADGGMSSGGGGSVKPEFNLCQTLCQAAYLAALTQCGGDPGCTQVVQAAYQVCLSQC